MSTFVEYNKQINTNLTVDFDGLASMNDALADVAGREKGRNVAAGADGWLFGLTFSEITACGGTMKASELCESFGLSGTYVSNATAVADIVKCIARGNTDDVAKYRSEKHVAKLDQWVQNFKTVYADENGAHKLNDLVTDCQNAIGIDGDRRPGAIHNLHTAFGDVDTAKKIARGPKVVDETPADDEQDDEQGTDVWQDMLRNALNVASSHGASATEVLAIVKEIFG